MALIAHWKLDDLAGGMVDDTGTLPDGTYFNSPTLGVPGIDGTAVDFDGVNQYATAAGSLAGITAWSASVNLRAQVPTVNNPSVLVWRIDSSNHLGIYQLGTGEFEAIVAWQDIISPVSSIITADAASDVTDWTMVTVTVDHSANTMLLYVDGQPVAATRTGVTLDVGGLPAGAGQYNLATNRVETEFTDTALDDVRIYDRVLTPSEVAGIWFGSPPGPVPAVLPTKFDGFLFAAASALPARFTGLAQTSAASLPTLFESAQNDYLNNAMTWGVTVVLDGSDISAQLSGPIDIESAEMESGLATIVITPPAGPIDPAAYERKSLTITFVGETYTQRRFTGITSTAIFDPDGGTMTIEATTDLQGQLENMERSAIDALIGGTWSEFVFDESADGWQYALDQLSTIASEIHANVYGALIVVPWAAKATPDITLTDTERFNDSLALSRSNLRDLITRVRILFDFRFTRLKHREIAVRFIDELGFCSWANEGWLLPSRNMVASAADGSEWNRTSDISYEELPPPDTYCSPPRGWVGDPDLLFCLGANWEAARRWAQTVTEEYGIDLIAPDLEEAIGIQRVNSNYGVEATYDSTDYERDRDFTAPPDGSTFSTKSFDWQIDADQTEQDGRTQMEFAQEVAMAVAHTLILERARQNIVSLAHIYVPWLHIADTVRVNTPYLTAKGKIARMVETLDVTNGAIGMTLEIAISRHDGSGLAVDSPLVAPPQPEQPQEENTGRTYTVGYHLGGKEFSPPDDETWDGYMTNVQESERFAGAPVYRTRFVLRMPEIETTARNPLAEDAVVPYEVAIPEDELTLSN